MNIAILLPVIFLCLLAMRGCSGSGDSDDDSTTTTLNFYFEYDYANDCDVFPNQNYDYLATRFDDANTVLWPTFSDAGIAGGYAQTDLDMLFFAQMYADGVVEYNENGVGYVNLSSDLYLASIHWHTDWSYLGKTILQSQKNKAMCFIFHDNVISKASEMGRDETTVMEAAVIHEMGHGRAGLTHLCNGYATNTTYHNPANSGAACVMSTPWPRPDCLDPEDASPLDYVNFCGKCVDNLKKVNW